MDGITVITLTRGRPHLLHRALLSVQSQDYPGVVRHLILIDDCEETAQAVAALKDSSNRPLVITHILRAPGEMPEGPAKREHVYPRIARLLNQGVRMADSRWISFLDDDNEFEPNHLSSLVSCAVRSDCSAVHSHRSILNANGSPYLEHR